MKIYDLTQELFSCNVYPGDPAPERIQVMSMEQGDSCNLTALHMCAHNGTHIDAPAHFIRDGKTVDALGLAPFAGRCAVVHRSGDLSAGDAAEILHEAAQYGTSERLLIGGKTAVTPEAAAVFAAAGLLLIGNESQTFGTSDTQPEVHRILLGAGTVLLEGIRLHDVPAGCYLLSAAPLLLGGCEGAPCRAFLTEIGAESCG